MKFLAFLATLVFSALSPRSDAALPVPPAQTAAAVQSVSMSSVPVADTQSVSSSTTVSSVPAPAPSVTSVTQTAYQYSPDAVTQSQLDQKLQILKNSLLSEMSKISAPSSQPAYNYPQLALVNKIDQLTNTALTTPTISSPSITGGTITNTTLSNPTFSSVSSLTLSGTLTGASAAFSGNVGIGTTTPSQKLVVQGNVLTLAEDAPVLAGTVTTGTAPYKVFVSGHYAYVTAHDAPELDIIDISTSTNMVLKSSISTNLTGPWAVYVAGKYAYVTNYNNGTSRLAIYDVSDPASPVAKGTVNTVANPDQVYVVGKYAYILGYNGGLGIYDISDPNNPIVKSTTTTNMFGPRGLYIAGKYAYVVNNFSGLSIFDISNPSNIIAKGITSTNLSGPNAVYVSGRYAYVVAYSNPGRLSIFDVSDPNTIVALGTITTNLRHSQGIVVSGKYAYVQNGSAGVNSNVAIFDVSDPNNPIAKGVSDNYPSGSFQGLAMQGKYVYVTDVANNKLVAYAINHTETPVLSAGNIQASFADVWDNLTVGNSLYSQGLYVGQQGIMTEGNFAAQGTSTSYFAGSLGIGTTTPWAQLSINPNALGSGVPEFIIGSSTRTHFIVDGGGNVGIGSTTPWRTLSVSGTVSFAGLTAGAGAGALCLSSANEVLYLSGSSACSVSSQRFKHDIATSTSGLSEILAMRPVTFTYNSDIGISGQQVGFIAEEMERLDPRLVVHELDGTPFSVKYENITAVLAKAIQELSAQLAGLRTWFADSANGIEEFFAGRIHTKTLCVGDSGNETCISKSQLDALLSNSGQNANSNGSGQTNSNSGDTTTPIISLIGQNPSQITIGTPYADLGATVTDTDAQGIVNSNLGLHFTIDGTSVTNISLDTSTTTTYTIVYSAIDSAGNTGYATRTVEVLP